MEKKKTYTFTEEQLKNFLKASYLEGMTACLTIGNRTEGGFCKIIDETFQKDYDTMKENSLRFFESKGIR